MLSIRWPKINLWNLNLYASITAFRDLKFFLCVFVLFCFTNIIKTCTSSLLVLQKLKFLIYKNNFLSCTSFVLRCQCFHAFASCCQNACFDILVGLRYTSQNLCCKSKCWYIPIRKCVTKRQTHNNDHRKIMNRGHFLTWNNDPPPSVQYSFEKKTHGSFIYLKHDEKWPPQKN